MIILFLSLFANLADLNQRVAWELDHIGFPEEWVPQREYNDVAIIGAGMAGIGAAFGLQRMGIHNIVLYDACPEGEEGPWLTYAQMKVLRTPKEAAGPSLFIPSLSFQAWYEAVYGESNWNVLVKASPYDWGQYLIWLRKRLKLPVKNNCRLLEIIPCDDHFELRFENFTTHAKKIILATGRKGCGGYKIPSFMKEIPAAAHTSEITDYSQFKGKKVGIIGCGTSAFDAAGAALEAGAFSVDLLYRRNFVPKVNKTDFLAHIGMEYGFYALPDTWKFKIIEYVETNGSPPPAEALERVKPYSNFHLRPNTTISNAPLEEYDQLILATGYKVSVSDIPELSHFSHHIKLWKDVGFDSEFPYLGSHYQFQGSEPFLKHIYCFNYGALQSFGLTSSSIDALSAGVEILSRGIASDFFHEQIDQFYNDLKNYQGDDDAAN